MEPLIGTIIQFGGNFAPRGWALCDGQLLAIAQNNALFSILGTTYGGDGKTTFALPDLRGRVPIQPGQGPGLSVYRLGEKGGHESVTLTINNMPSHNHELLASSDYAKLTNPAGQVLAIAQADVYSEEAANTPLKATSISHVGGSQPVDLRQPYLCVNFIIALVGVFPSRS